MEIFFDGFEPNINSTWVHQNKGSTLSLEKGLDHFNRTIVYFYSNFVYPERISSKIIERFSFMIQEMGSTYKGKNNFKRPNSYLLIRKQRSERLYIERFTLIFET